MRLTRALTGFAAAVAVMAASVAAYAGTVVSQKFASPTLGRNWVYNVYSRTATTRASCATT